MKFVRTFTVQFPVWDEDGNRTDEKVERVKALFKEEVQLLNGNATKVKYGSYVLNEGVDAEEVAKDLADHDWSEELYMEPIEGSTFYKVRAR